MAAFQVNPLDIVAEDVDGEVLILNLRSGVYYSSDGTGGVTWALLAAQVPVNDIVARLSTGYGIDAARVRPAVEAFVDELAREGLIVPCPDGEPPPGGPDMVGGAVFEAPTLHKYTDFQDLLRLDPIHDADPAAGWPHVKPSG
jgi:hypothetical protein